MKALVVLFISNKFEVAVQLIGIQSKVNASVCLQYNIYL